MTSIFKIDPNNYVSIISTQSSSQSRRVVLRTGDAVSEKSKDDATFFLIGQVTHSQLKYHKPEKGRPDQYYCDLSLKPIHRFLPRVVAIVSNLLKFSQPVFPITFDGLSFSTLRKVSDKSRTPFSRYAPMNGITHGPCASSLL